MIVKESDIRAKIRRLLAEDFKFYDGKRKIKSDVNSTDENGCVVFDLTSKPVASNILHRLTKGSETSYEAWKIVFEKIFIANMKDVKDRNIKNSNNVFHDVEWKENAFYSVKSTLQKATIDSFQTKAYGGNPTFTKSFIEGLENDRKIYNIYGIIVATRIKNELIWQVVGEAQTGWDIFKKYKALLAEENWSSIPKAEDILNALNRGQNPQTVIQYFFGEGYTDVLKVKLAPQTLSYEEENPLLEKIYDKIDELQYAVEKYAFINKDKPNNDTVLDQIENDIKTLVDFVSRAMNS